MYHVSVVLDDFADGLHRVLGASRVDFEVLDGSADLVDVVARLIQDVVDFLSEPDDRVVERTGGFLVGLDVELELARNAIEFLKDRLLVILHAGRFVEQPNDGELVFFQMAKDLSGKLVESDTDLLDVEERVTGDLAATTQIDGRGHRQQTQRRTAQPVNLDPGKARAFVDSAFANTANPRCS